MTEWLKVRAWKVRIPQKGIVGSNPAFSAKFFEKNRKTTNFKKHISLINLKFKL